MFSISNALTWIKSKLGLVEEEVATEAEAIESKVSADISADAPAIIAHVEAGVTQWGLPFLEHAAQLWLNSHGIPVSFPSVGPAVVTPSPAKK